jgi:hypothetical protein
MNKLWSENVHYGLCWTILHRVAAQDHLMDLLGMRPPLLIGTDEIPTVRPNRFLPDQDLNQYICGTIQKHKAVIYILIQEIWNVCELMHSLKLSLKSNNTLADRTINWQHCPLFFCVSNHQCKSSRPVSRPDATWVQPWTEGAELRAAGHAVRYHSAKRLAFPMFCFFVFRCQFAYVYLLAYVRRMSESIIASRASLSGFGNVKRFAEYWMKPATMNEGGSMAARKLMSGYT